MSRHSNLYGESGGIFIYGGLFMPVYKNSDMMLAIDEYVHNPRYRELLRLRYCDGYTYEQIAEAVNFSPQHVKKVCQSYKALLLSHL